MYLKQRERDGKREKNLKEHTKRYWLDFIKIDRKHL